jgi:DNA (cytosine-5)-methyltransferase 1
MSRPKLLDLFCRAAGAGVGYHRAGFDVTGVDILPQASHPANGLFGEEGMRFICADALDYLRDYGGCYDAIHASPPCQAFSRVQSLGKARNGSYSEHPDLVEPTRELLLAAGKPYVMENVPGAPLRNPSMLCGSMFPPLRVYRHRIFETNWPLMSPPHAPHRDKTPSAGNGISPKGFISVCGAGGVRGMTEPEITRYWQMAMGIDWMGRNDLAQAIPPAFTRFIGDQMLSQMEGSR